MVCTENLICRKKRLKCTKLSCFGLSHMDTKSMKIRVTAVLRESTNDDAWDPGSLVLDYPMNLNGL